MVDMGSVRKIECLLKRSKPVEVPISGDWYVFEPDPQGRLVAEVRITSHVNAFLARKDLYREVAEQVEDE